jgi:hypothetical protein
LRTRTTEFRFFFVSSVKNFLPPYIINYKLIFISAGDFPFFRFFIITVTLVCGGGGSGRMEGAAFAPAAADLHWAQGQLQGCAACAAAQGAERVGAPIPNHKFENSLSWFIS